MGVEHAGAEDVDAEHAAPEQEGGEQEGGEQEGADQDGAEPARGGLSDRDRAVLDLARRTWSRPGAKERAIREQLGMSPTRYYQVLNALLDTPDALEHDPVTVNRLRRMRDARRSRR
ncbi:DUF3263 domain-containing protein [Wenjunlia tyrosinilytica]|uniref:DUF3263 domain-containing protein n=1 Tax=Wenjunlia tyrosinilytica TaxID=1544741 RepID=UPI00166B1241